MDRSAIVQLAAGALAGLLVGAAVWSVTSAGSRADAAFDRADPEEVSLDSLRALNTKLVESNQNADKIIAELRAQLPTPPAPPSSLPLVPSGPPGVSEARARLLAERAELSPDDWARMAESGSVRFAIPCLRNDAWTPAPHQLSRMGLAPQDKAMLREAYEHSNKRLADLLRPLCAKVLGKTDAIDLTGAKACLDLVLTDAKTRDKQATDRALVRVAQTNAGKAPASADATGVESLLVTLTGEMKTFEADLAAKVGPEEAKQITSSFDLCTDRGLVRARAEHE